jgi:hypothetical protein
MGVNGQRHSPSALYPRGKGPPVPIGQEAGWAPDPVWTKRLEEKSFTPIDRSSSPQSDTILPELTRLLHIKLQVKIKITKDVLLRHGGAKSGRKYSSFSFLTSELHGSERSASRPGRASPGERPPRTHSTGGWSRPIKLQPL